MQLDYANIGWRSDRRALPEHMDLPQREFNILGPRRLAEAYRGTAIVAWQGKIERQLQELAAENTEARNHAYADKLRAFLANWRANPLSGSINVETVEKLLAASEVPAVDDWRYSNFFSNLRDQLRKLKASVEELPMGGEVPPEQRAPMSSPPSSFGPSDTPPLGGASGQIPPEPGAEADSAAAALDGGAPENLPDREEIPGT